MRHLTHPHQACLNKHLFTPVQVAEALPISNTSSIAAKKESRTVCDILNSQLDFLRRPLICVGSCPNLLEAVLAFILVLVLFKYPDWKAPFFVNGIAPSIPNDQCQNCI